MTRNLNIYACGGAGTNITNKLSELGIDAKFIFADTSDSDVNKSNDDNTFIFPVKTSGSGGIRTTNVEIIKDHIDSLIKRFPPSDINIVISSTSGGSGSVISPVLVDKLKSANKNVILLLVVSNGSALEITNSYKTLESFYNIANNKKSSIVTYIKKNNSTKDNIVDNSMIDTICKIYYLWVNNYKSLDTNDLNSWLNYADKVLEKGTLLELCISKHSAKDSEIQKNVEKELKNYKTIFTTLTLSPEGFNLEFPKDVIINSNYEGYYDPNKVTEPSYYIHSIVSNYLYAFYKDIKNKALEIEEEVKRRSTDTLSIQTDDNIGLVL